jgi:hypothetical protein
MVVFVTGCGTFYLWGNVGIKRGSGGASSRPYQIHTIPTQDDFLIDECRVANQHNISGLTAL